MQKISAPFNPLSVSGCAIWLDGADTSTSSMTFSSGSNLSVWKDKSTSSNNFNLTSGTITSVIDGAYTSVNIGSSGIMTSVNQITFTTTSAFFTVSKVTTTSSYPATSISFPNIYGGDYSIRFQSGVLDGTPAHGGNGNDFASGNYYVNGSFNPNYDSTNYYNVYCVIDTVAPTTGGTSYLMLSTAFGSPVRSFAGNIAEIIYYPAGVTSPQRQLIEGYLAQKWGLTANLPPGHPGLTQTIYTSNYNAKNPGSAITPSPTMTNTPYPTLSPINLGGTGGCVMWLDAADSSTLTLSGANVSQWNDKSGSGNSVTQASSGSQPTTGGSLNGLNTLYFTGKTMGYTGISISAQTVFCIYLNNTFTPYGGPVSIGPFNFFYAAPGNNVGIGRTAATDEILASWSTNGLSTSKYTIYGGTVSVTSSTTSILYFNGNQVGSNTVVSSGGVTRYNIGSYYADTTGYIAEVLIYNTVLAIPQRQQVEGYLAWKWGLQVNLPPTHPYYNIPPGRPSQLAGIPLVKQMTHPTVPGYYPFYQVDSNTWTTGWLPYLQQLVAANANATANTTLGTITGTSVGFYVASFLAPNGLIYLMDNTNNPMGVITPTANGGVYSSTTVTGVGPYTQYGDNYKGGGLASNGIIYLVPFGAPGIGTINTNTNVYTTNPYNANPGGAAVAGGVLAPDGNIYCAPYVNSSQLFYFTPGANTLNSFSISTAQRYNKPFLAPNGKIYCLGSPKILCVIDPIAKTFTEVGTSASQQYAFMVLGGNGVVYAFPLNATGIGTLDLTTNIITANVISGGTGYYGGILGPDGNIYLYQSGAGNIGVLNTKTNTLSVLTTTTNGYLSAVLAANGNIYLGAANVIVFSGVTQTPTLNFCLTPNLNNGADRF